MKRMRLRTPTEDFLERSIGAIANVFDRLRYFAALQDASGYSHWGMEHEYGKEAASKAIGEVHSKIWLDATRARLRDLESEARHLPANESRALGKDTKVIPADTAGVSPRHFAYAMEAVALLTESRSEHSAA